MLRESERAPADVRAANRRYFDSPSVTLSYVADRYHVVRRQVVGEVFVRALDQSGVPSGPIVEIGAGAESIAGMLPDLRRPVFLFDSSEAVLRALKAEQFPVVNADASQPLPFLDRSLAAVIVSELIEHLYDPMTLLTELQRVVKPGGVVVLSTPNLAILQDRIRFLAGRSPRQIDPLHDYLKLHVRQFTVGTLRRMLDRAGFVVTRIRSNYVGFRLPGGRWVQSRRLARLVPSLGGTLIAVARRRVDGAVPPIVRVGGRPPNLVA